MYTTLTEPNLSNLQVESKEFSMQICNDEPLYYWPSGRNMGTAIWDERQRCKSYRVRLGDLGKRRELLQQWVQQWVQSFRFRLQQISISMRIVKYSSSTSRQIWGTKPKMGQMGIPGKLFFFQGHVVKNRDCPGKSGTDGHLTDPSAETIKFPKGLTLCCDQNIFSFQHNKQTSSPTENSRLEHINTTKPVPALEPHTDLLVGEPHRHAVHILITPHLVGMWSTAMSCVYVCLSARISKMTRPNFIKFSIHFLQGYLSLVMWG